jgi:catechol 2,3-dioxygenase-like lactoylglutathione lyase family enzyme
MNSAQFPVYAGLVPMLPVTDVPRAIEFYQQLGFQVGNSHAPEGESAPNWAWLFSGQAHVMVNLADRPVEVTHHSVAVWLYTRDVKSAHSMLAARGLDVGQVEYPFYNEGGEFHVHDPDGYAVFVAHLDPTEGATDKQG